jgi:hypothetical protein
MAVGLAVLLAGCTTGSIRPRVPVRLAYRGTAGDVRTWQLEQVVRGEFAFNGMPQLLVITLRGRLTETIEEVTPEGRRRVTQAWAFEPIEFNGMPMPLEAIPRQVVSHALRGPDGDLESLESPAAAGDLLAWAARWLGGFFPRLADHPVLAGDPWTRTEQVPAATGIVFNQTTGGTLTGMDGATALLDTMGEIAMSRTTSGDVAPVQASQVSATPAQGSMEAFTLAFSGHVRFATPAGYVTESRQDGTVSFKGRTGRSPLGIRARFTSTLTLVP